MMLMDGWIDEILRILDDYNPNNLVYNYIFGFLANFWIWGC